MKGRRAASALLVTRLVAITGDVLRSGQQVIFTLDVTDPDGDDIALNVVTPALREADVIIDDATVTWKVIDRDVADPAYVSFFVTSKRCNHWLDTHDDAVTFAYRVVPA